MSEYSNFILEFINNVYFTDDEDISNVLNKLQESASNEYNVLLKKIENNFERKCLKLIKSSTTLIESFNRENNTDVREKQNASIDLTSLHNNLERIGSELQAALIVTNYDDAVDCFLELMKLRDETKQILEFQKPILSTADNLLPLLLNNLETDFEKFLSLHNWLTDIPKKLTQESNEVIERNFLTAFRLLLVLSPFQSLLSPEKRLINLKNIKKLPLLPVQVLLKPYLKKFTFHFYGSKKTNNILKPEWYFTQLLLWAEEKRDFLENLFQKGFDNNQLTHVNAFTEFLEGLVSFGYDKILNDMPALLEHSNELAFVHLIDEVVHFQQRLYDHNENVVSCVDALCEGPCFERWIGLEKKLALLRMDDFLSSPKAWSYGEEDDNRIPECGDHFFMLINTVSERNRLLTNINCSLQFALLTNHLLDDMRIRLVQIRKQIQSSGILKSESVAPKFVLIVNFVSMVIHLVAQWSMQPFYDRLFHYSIKKVRKLSLKNENSGNNYENNYKNNYDDKPRDSDDDEDDDNINIIPDNLMQISDSSFFSEILELYEKLKNDMTSTILTCILEEFKKKSKPYQRNKFIPGHSLKDFVSPTLSQSACDMLNYLRRQLANLRLVMSVQLFSAFWQQLAGEVDACITENVIFANHFNETGAAQLKFDLCDNLFPIFSAYTVKPDSYFKSIKECCVVLTLNRGLVALLRETLSRAMQPSMPRLKNADPLATLNDLGVQRLSVKQVETLISLRVDWPSMTSVPL